MTTADIDIGVSEAKVRRRLTDHTRVAALTRHGTRLLLVVVTLAALSLPIFSVFRGALENRADGVRRFLHDPYAWESVRTTFLFFAVAVVVVALPLGTALAWFSHCLPPGRRWMGAIPLIPLLLPSFVRVLGFIFLLSPRPGYLNATLRLVPPFHGRLDGPFNVYTPGWIVIITALEYTPLVVLFMRASMSQLHQDVIDAAIASGASPRRAFMRVVVPLLRPATIYAATTVMVLALGQFIVPLFLGRQSNIKVLSTQLFEATQRFPRDTALATSYALPILVAGLLLIALQRILLRNQDRFVMSTGHGTRAVRSNGKFAQGCLLLYGFLTVILPLVALIIVSLSPYWLAEVKPSTFTLDHYHEVFETPNLTSAITHSLKFAVLTALVVLPLAYTCAKIIYRRHTSRALATMQEVVVTLPLGIPAVILGVGFLLVYTTTPIRLFGTTEGVVLIYVTILIPFATRFLLVTMTNVGEAPLNAAAASGAGPLRRLFRIEIPLLRSGIAVALALVFVLAAQEFQASVLVRSAPTQVMGTIMFELFTNGSFGTAAVMGLLTCAVAGVGMALALMIGGRGSLRPRG